jgi:tetratricopeptide (TPR) repeat protein
MPDRLADKVLLVGWGAADWALCEPLLTQGLMPNLERLIDQGGSGGLASLMPTLAPVTWTSIATGKRPYKHGIHGMFEPDPDVGGIRPASRHSRATKAVWNIVAQQGLVAHVIGWPGAHPAESTGGIGVTDRHAIARVEFGKPWPQPEGSFYPPEIGPALASLRIHPDELDRDFLTFFVPQLKTMEAAKLGKLSLCARLLAATVTNHAAATWALEHQGWNLAAVCYPALEQLTHSFLQFMPPHQMEVSSQDFETYQHILPACYQFHDRMLGRLIELAGNNTTVMLVSNHGCKTGAMRPQRFSAAPEDVEAWHRRQGLFVISGPYIKRASHISNASILDVTPTVLTLFGLKTAADMDGRPLQEVFAVDADIDCLPSWDDVPGVAGPQAPPESDPDQEIKAALAQLEKMGYRDPQEDRLAASREQVIDLNKFNLARSLIDGNRVAEAIEILSRLAAKPSPPPGATTMLLEAYLLAGQLDDAQRTIGKLAPPFAETPLIRLARGRIELARGRPAAALDHLRHAVTHDGANIRIHVFMGQAYLDLRRWSHAGDAFQRALELQADHPEALFGKCVVALRQGDAVAAVRFASAAIEANPSLPEAHYYLGMALRKLGRRAEATSSLERALQLNPGWGAARRVIKSLRNT